MSLSARYAELDALINSVNGAQQQRAEFSALADTAEAELATLLTEISALEAHYECRARAAADARERCVDASAELACLRTSVAAAAATTPDSVTTESALSDALSLADTESILAPCCEMSGFKTTEHAVLTDTERHIVDAQLTALAPVTSDGLEAAAAYVTGCYGIRCTNGSQLGATIPPVSDRCTACIALHTSILARSTWVGGACNIDWTTIDAVDAAALALARARAARDAASAVVSSPTVPAPSGPPAVTTFAAGCVPRRTTFHPPAAPPVSQVEGNAAAQRATSCAAASASGPQQSVRSVDFATTPPPPPRPQAQPLPATLPVVATRPAVATAAVAATRRRPRLQRVQAPPTRAAQWDADDGAPAPRSDSFWDDARGHDDWGA